MNLSFRKVFLVLIGTATAAAVGCTQQAENQQPAAVAQNASAPADELHGEWWCGEHGVPEEVCALCDTSLVAEFKQKGDWCDEHNRPDSQCFACHPELEAKFAAQYEAKYGKKPPKPADNQAEHDHDHQDGDHEHGDHDHKHGDGHQHD